MTQNAEDKSRGPVHLGKKTQRVREVIGLKQSDLAERTGMSQQNISKLEQSEYIPDDMLEKIAEGLGVTSEFIKSFDDERVMYNIQTNFTYQDYSVSHSQHHNPTINHDSSAQLNELLDKAVKVLVDLSEQIRVLQGKKGAKTSKKGKK